MIKLLVPVALFAAVAAPLAYAAAQPAEAWRIGPVIRGKNHSVGIGGTLREGPQGPWFQFPVQGQGHVNYATLDTGPIEGARTITVRYRIDADRGTAFVSHEDRAPGRFGLVMHRAGDTWTAKGRYEAYRYYSPATIDLTPGEHVFRARLDDPEWISVLGRRASENPGGFSGMLADTQSISLSFGSSGRRGHGVYATGPARFTILDFRIE